LAVSLRVKYKLFFF